MVLLTAVLAAVQVDILESAVPVQVHFQPPRNEQDALGLVAAVAGVALLEASLLVQAVLVAVLACLGQVVMAREVVGLLLKAVAVAQEARRGNRELL